MQENTGKVLVISDELQHFEVLGKLVKKLETQRDDKDAHPFKRWQAERMIRAAKRELGWNGNRLPRPALEIGQELQVSWTGGDFHDAVLGGRPAREGAGRVQRVKADGRATLLMYPVPEVGAILWGADFQWQVLWVKNFKVGVRPMLVKEVVQEA